MSSKNKPPAPSPPKKERGSLPSIPDIDAPANPKAKSPRLSELDPNERAAIEQLAEVETAMARLEGRSTEMPEERIIAQRDAEKRKAEIAAKIAAAGGNIAKNKRRARLRLAVTGIVVVAALAGAALFFQEVERESRENAGAASAATLAEAPFTSAGFAEVARGMMQLEAQASKDTCYVALGASASGAAKVTLDREIGPSAPESSLLWCACADERIKVKAAGTTRTAVALLALPAAKFGGLDRLDALPAKAAMTLRDPSRACAEEQLDVFVSAHDGARPDLTSKELAPLLKEGFTPWLHESAAPLAALSNEKGTCFVVSAPGATKLWVRVAGGARPLEVNGPTLAFCHGAEGALAVGHQGGDAVDAVAVAALRVGGTIGLSEVLARAGVAVKSVGAVDLDPSADAKSALFPSGIPLNEPLDLDHPSAAEAVFAFTTRDPHGLQPLDFDLACAPALSAHPMGSMCVDGHAAVRDRGKLPDGAAAAPKPRWLASLTGDPAGAIVSLKVLALARRLMDAGFTLTTLEEVKETPDGAEVTGRAREKDVVVVALAASAPWVWPLTEGPAWTLDDAPHVIPLAAGAKIALTGIPLYSTRAHEVLVFRR